MSRLYRCVIGEVDSSPFAPRSKMIADEVTSSLIGAGASLVGNLLGFGSNKSANQTNLEIARQNNEMQYKMFKEQLAYNEDMWNKQNAYNDPSAQVQRLLAAGINPSAVFGAGSVSEAGSLQAPSAPSLQQAHVNPFTPDLSGVGDAVNAFFDNQLKNKQIKALGLDNEGKQIDLQFKASQLMLNIYEQIGRIDNQLADTNLKGEQREFLIKQREDLENHIEVYKAQMKDLKVRESKQNDVLDSQSSNLLADATLKYAQSRYQNILIKYYPKIASAQINQLNASAGELIQRTANLVKEGVLTDYKTTEQFLKNQLLNLTNSEEFNRHEHNPRYSVGVAADVSGLADWLTDLLLHNLKLTK